MNWRDWRLVVCCLMSVSCGGAGGDVTPPFVQKSCTVVLSTDVVRLLPTEEGAVNVSGDCRSISASGASIAMQTFTPPGIVKVPPGSSNGTVTVTGTSTDGLIATKTFAVLVAAAPTLAIDVIKTRKSVELNGSLEIVLNKANVVSCEYQVTWNKSGKEDAATVAPSVRDSSGVCTPVFSPGSTMPVGSRTAVFSISGANSNGLKVTDVLMVQLVVPVIQVDSLSPSKWPQFAGGILAFFSFKNSFTSTNGVDFNGTVAGLCPGMVTNPGSFLSAGKYQGGGVFVDSPGRKLQFCINNWSRPASETKTLEVTMIPAS